MSRAKLGVGVYLALAFGISWVLWLSMLADGWEPGEDVSWALFQGAFAPAIAAVAVRLWIEKDFSDAGFAPRLVRGWRYYLIGWLFPLPAAVLVLGLGQLSGLVQVDWSLASGVAELSQTEAEAVDKVAGGARSLWLLSLISALTTTPILFGEEFGWRGYLQKRLLPSRPLAAAALTGVAWSLWHLPLNLAGYNFPGHPLLGMIVFTVSCILLSIIFGWLTLASGSVWPACLAHASTNAVGASLVLLGSGGQSIMVHYLGVLGWIPLGALAGWIVVTGRLHPRPEPDAFAPLTDEER